MSKSEWYVPNLTSKVVYERTLREMEMGENGHVGDMKIKRVPGGWIFTPIGGNSVYVHFEQVPTHENIRVYG